VTEKVDRFLATLPDTEAELLRRALLDENVGHTEIAETLSRHGHKVSEAAVRRWRTRARDARG
jgi:hypothetical protein